MLPFFTVVVLLLSARSHTGKVGSTYIKYDEDSGAVAMFDARKFKEQHKHLAYWEREETTDDDGETKQVLKKKPFIDRWMKDERMDPQYLDKADEGKRYYWDSFDMYPDKKQCPRDVFNLWPGFAAEKMKTDLGSLRAAAALLPGS